MGHWPGGGCRTPLPDESACKQEPAVSLVTWLNVQLSRRRQASKDRVTGHLQEGPSCVDQPCYPTAHYWVRFQAAGGFLCDDTGGIWWRAGELPHGASA